MSVIFPGNYVANLNAYRGQGVFAIPGIEFYQVRGVRSCVGLHRIDHSAAGITGNFTEVRVLTQVHHCGGIHQATVITISEGRNVALTHVLNHFQQVCGYIKFARLTVCVCNAQGAA